MGYSQRQGFGPVFVLRYTVYGICGILYPMPKVMIWVRKDDLSKWRAIGNKPQWLHEQLNSASPQPIDKADVQPVLKIKRATFITSFCKNGHPIPEGRSKCLGKGCKYS